MSYQQTWQAVLENLQEIEELVKGFPENDMVPVLDIDLSLQKIRNLYEIMLLLKRSVEPMQKVPSQVVHEPMQNRTEPSPAQPVPAGNQKETKHAEIPVAKEESSEPPVDPASGKETEAQILSDRFKGRTTLHETLHQSISKNAGTLSQAKPISDLMSAIGINDRFTFIREMFNNDASLFENTIKLFNEAPSFNDAYNYMIQHFDWDMDSESVQMLLEIIRRKHITGKHE